MRMGCCIWAGGRTGGSFSRHRDKGRLGCPWSADTFAAQLKMAKSFIGFGEEGSAGLLMDPKGQRTGSVQFMRHLFWFFWDILGQNQGILAPNRTLWFLGYLLGFCAVGALDKRNVPWASTGLLDSVHPVCQSHSGLKLTLARHFC